LPRASNKVVGILISSNSYNKRITGEMIMKIIRKGKRVQANSRKVTLKEKEEITVREERIMVVKIIIKKKSLRKNECR
jgi:hypothetical protein